MYSPCSCPANNLTSCRYFDKKGLLMFTCRNFTWFLNPQFGNCYIFNSGWNGSQVLTSHKSGEEYGERMVWEWEDSIKQNMVSMCIDLKSFV